MVYKADFTVDNQVDLYEQVLTTNTGAITRSGDTINVSQTTTNQSVIYPKISPEGQRVVYVLGTYDPGSGNTTRQLMLTELETPAPVSIADSFTYAHSPIYQLQWRPSDGSFVLFLGQPNVSNKYEVQVVPLSGTDLTEAGSWWTLSGTTTSNGSGNCSWIR